MGRLVFLSTDCQDLIDTMHETAANFEEALLNNDYIWSVDEKGVTMDEKLIWEIKSLCRKLGTNSPVTPFKLFSMNRGALLAALTTVLTYTVVFLQFKAAEAPVL